MPQLKGLKRYRREDTICKLCKRKILVTKFIVSQVQLLCETCFKTSQYTMEYILKTILKTFLTTIFFFSLHFSNTFRDMVQKLWDKVTTHLYFPL